MYIHSGREAKKDRQKCGIRLRHHVAIYVVHTRRNRDGAHHGVGSGANPLGMLYDFVFGLFGFRGSSGSRPQTGLWFLSRHYEAMVK